MRIITTVAQGALALLLLASGCASTDPGPADGSGPGDERLDVVASFYPLAFAAERIGGDAVTVTNLTPPGVEPHDLELAPDDVEAIAEADVVLFLGGGFQPAVAEAVDVEGSGIAVDVAEGLASTPATDGEFETDPHVWLAPALFAEVSDAIAEALGRAAPPDGSSFEASGADLRSELEGLDARFADGLAECDSRLLLTNHAAFAYLAAAYDLRQEAISGLAPEAEPDPRRIADLAELARAEGVSTVFTEDLVSPEVAEALASEAGLRTDVLSPLEGLTPEQLEADDDYISVMDRNLDSLRSGLGCS